MLFTNSAPLAIPIDHIDYVDPETETVGFKGESEENFTRRPYALYEVPLKKIAGVLPLSFKQEIYTEDAPFGKSRASSANEELLGLYLKQIGKKGIRVPHDPDEQVWQIQHQFRQQQAIKVGSIAFDEDTALYCDWNYLSQRAGGGLKSMGVGLVGLSFSAGWSSTLWQSFRSRVISSTAPLKEAHRKPEVTVSGHVVFLTGPLAKSIEMEGGKWQPVLLTEKKIENYLDVPSAAWLLAYLRKDCFMLPMDLWELFTNPIQIYGEMIPAELKTEFGSSKGFLKVRAAAHIEFV